MKTIYTIGFTRKTLQEFIVWLRAAVVSSEPPLCYQGDYGALDRPQ